VKKFLCFLALLLLLPAYCALPLKSVAALTLTVTDRNGAPLKDGVTAAFFDAEGNSLAVIATGTPPSWENNIHWWAHSRYPGKSIGHPRDAKRAVRAVLNAPGCAPLEVPVHVETVYEALSFAPHGGGPAYMYYRFEKTVQMDCAPQPAPAPQP